MKSEKEVIKTNLKLEKTPKKAYNTEGNKNLEKFRPYYPNNIFSQYSSKRSTQYKSLNNKISFSVDKKNANFPLFNKGQQFLSKNKKEWSNIDVSNTGNIYEKLNVKNPYERDNLLIQIYHTQKDINKANKEIKDLKKMQEIIEKENLANRFMISQLLNKNKQVKIEPSYNSIQNNKEEENNNKANNESFSNKKENKIQSKSVKKVKESLFKNGSFNNKDKSNTKAKSKVNTIKKEKNVYLDSDKLKINILKKGLNYYKYHLNKKEEELAEFKDKEEVKNYKQINDLIEKKNKILEELIQNNNEINFNINMTDQQIINLSMKIYNMKEIL